MSILDSFIKGKTVISISPFNHQKVYNGATWRITFIVNYLKEKTKDLYIIMRFDANNPSSASDFVFGGTNRYIHLLSPILLIKIIKILVKQKHESVFYCHTFLTGLYGIFFRVFFKKKFIFDNHNVEFDRFKSCHSSLTFFIFIFEFILIKLSHLVIFSSIQDQKRAKELYGFFSNSCVVENSFEHQAPIISYNKDAILKQFSLPQNKKIILFYGSFDYFPNQEAFDFIGSSIVPFLNYKDYCVVVAGYNSEQFSDQYENIACLGFVDNLKSLISVADLIIAPIFSGGGVKIKILEALAQNKYIITTSEGVRGINYIGYNLIVSDKASFLKKIQDHFVHAYA